MLVLPDQMITAKENIVLDHLRKNSRITLTDISRNTDLPITTVFEIIDRLNKKGVITRFASLLDFSKIGYAIRINLLLKARDKDDLQEFLVKSEHTNTVQKINSGLLAECIFNDFSSYEIFKEKLDTFGILSFDEHVVIKELKQHGALIKV